jgi:hypothetical protein
MPETAVNENDFAPFSEDNIGMTRQILRMKPVAVSEGEYEFSNQQFGP